MPEPDDGLHWDSLMYRKHVKATQRSWDRSLARQWSSRPGSHAQYNPRIPREDIERIEMECARGVRGVVLEQLSNSTTYFYEHHEIIGVSKGQFTKFIIIHRAISGSVHGYPIPEDVLLAKIRKVKKSEEQANEQAD